MKVHIGHTGKVITYGLDGEKARNYVKFGLYVKDDDPRLVEPKAKREKRRARVPR